MLTRHYVSIAVHAAVQVAQKNSRTQPVALLFMAILATLCMTQLDRYLAGPGPGSLGRRRLLQGPDEDMPEPEAQPQLLPPPDFGFSAFGSVLIDAQAIRNVTLAGNLKFYPEVLLL